jgi:hypothetical protein
LGECLATGPRQGALVERLKAIWARAQGTCALAKMPPSRLREIGMVVRKDSRSLGLAIADIGAKMDADGSVAALFAKAGVIICEGGLHARSELPGVARGIACP